MLMGGVKIQVWEQHNVYDSENRHYKTQREKKKTKILKTKREYQKPMNE